MKLSRKQRQYLYIILLLVACGVVAKGVWGMWPRFQKAHTAATIAQKELQHVEARAKQVADSVEYLEDPRGREIELRKRFDVGLPGETLVVVTEGEAAKVESIEGITILDRIRASLPAWLRW